MTENEEGDEVYDSEEMETTITPRRLRYVDVFVCFFIFIKLTADALSKTTDYIVGILAAHSNFVRERRDFQEGIRAQLESLPTKEK